ncbi:class I SAM-dependent methyltransferase [Microbacterium sp. p3-SID336]|uniref:class I SAM-dependent DNA methyltransferase n=1 Tax=Microbacterium sp. p3-SID336 TaxID=2916212 RepID=UPI0021A58D5C|nr:class I SAM-dependent methyltransferase [Microbacterium sp. p3-SID336]MCT1479501.1 class I SAM-dependent methyltransferase [Microbacterium sp. p3-SID336]
MTGAPDGERADATVGAAYDGRADEYRAVAGELAQMDSRDRELIGRWRDETPGRLLDAGCGPGHWAAFLHDDGREVDGVDVSAAFVEGARLRYPELSFRRGSFRALPHASATVGGVLAWYSVIHTPPAELRDVLAEFARVLAPGGSLLLGYFHGEPRERFAHAVTPAYFWTAEALSPMLAAVGLDVQWSEVREREPGEISSRPHGALRARRCSTLS